MKRQWKHFVISLVLSLGTLLLPGQSQSTQAGNTNGPWLSLAVTNQIAALTIHDPTTNAGNIHDVWVSTNLTAPGNWTWLVRCAPGQTNLTVTNCPLFQGFFQLGLTNAIRPGFTNSSLPPEDDNPSFEADLPMTVNFYGGWYSNLWVNENGNVTFDGAWGNYVTAPLSQVNMNIIAPFWADVDSRNPGSGVVTYGTNTVNGRVAFGVDWVNVGYFNTHADRLLSCQLVLIDRSDIDAGDFDMEFNYFQVQWEWGDASVGYPPRAGFANGTTNTVELPGSGLEGAFMDTNTVTGLIYNSQNSAIPGRYIFSFRNGTPLP